MEEELDAPRAALEQAGHPVRVASTDRQRARGWRGGSVRPDLLLSQVAPAEFLALVYAGGFGAAALLEHPAAVGLAERADRAGLVLGGICYGAAVLARAGCLMGHRATTYPEARLELERGGAVYTGRGVEVDRRVVTAAGPDDSASFGNALVARLAGRLRSQRYSPRG